jgi:pyruvate kinase
MLESMISSPIPTRAETSDVANAVLDGADAVMLSGETSVGEYPVITVQTMARIVESTEVHGLDRIPALGTKPRTQGGAVTLAAEEVANFVEAKFVVVFTESGDSVRRMSRLRSKIPMIGLTPEEGIRNRMALTWGVESYLTERVKHTDQLMVQVDEVLLGNALAESGDKVVVICGSPPGKSGTTNDMRIHVVGSAHNPSKPEVIEN